MAVDQRERLRFFIRYLVYLAKRRAHGKFEVVMVAGTPDRIEKMVEQIKVENLPQASEHEVKEFMGQTTEELVAGL